MKMKWTFPLFAALTLVAAPPPADAARPQASYRYAYAHGDCAPWDGAAIRLVLRTAPLPTVAPGTLPPATYPMYTVSLWTGKPPVGRWFPLPSPSAGGGDGDLTGASSIIEYTAVDKLKNHKGRLRLDAHTSTHLQGELRITLPDGTGRELVFPFDAPILEYRTLCG